MSEKAYVRPRLSSEERRISIVESACKLFAEKGFRGTTTRELAAAVGVTEPVLYEHFKTKRDLYSAIIDVKSGEGMEQLLAAIHRHSSLDDDRGFFMMLGRSIVQWYTVDSSFIRLLLFSNLENHELKDLFHERSSRLFSEVAQYIDRRIQQGAIRSVNPSIAARAFFGMVAHYALTGLVFGCWVQPQTPEEVLEGMVDVYLGGMCNQEKS